VDWPIPGHKCDTLEDCRNNLCYVPRLDPESGQATTPYIPALFFKGDYKGPHGRLTPVVFVSGFQVQLVNPPDLSYIRGVLDSLLSAFEQPANVASGISGIWDATVGGIVRVFDSTHPSGFGFTEESSFSTRPPKRTPPEGRHDSPPPIMVTLPNVSTGQEFYGLEIMLKCAAGYDHVRFSISHPGDEIQIAVDELYSVVEETKRLYGVDKVILVCHSRGGLVARKYILDTWNREHRIDVEKLITYGTAHLGAQLADVAEELITEPIIWAALPVPLAELIDLLGCIPGVGQLIKDRLQGAIIAFIAQLVKPIWDELSTFLSAGEELKPGSSFITGLNTGYGAAVVPVGDQLVPLWQAFDHVLIAGISPTFFTLYLGSYLPHISGASAIIASIADQLTPRLGTRTVRIGPVKIRVPYLYWEWNWTWHPVFRVIADMTPLSPVLASAECMWDGRGDGIVEKRSAHAEGVVGRIRRAAFKLHHFAVKANCEQYTTYESPSGNQMLVNPWQLLFVELGITEFRLLTQCDPEKSCCTDFDIAKAA